MKFVATLFSLVAVLATATAQAGSSSEMKNVVFAICTPQKAKCLEVKSESALGTELAPLYTFGHAPQVTLSEKNLKSETFTAQSAYFDLGNNQIVLIQKLKGKMIERSFSFNNLAEQRFVTDIRK